MGAVSKANFRPLPPKEVIKIILIISTSPLWDGGAIKKERGSLNSPFKIKTLKKTDIPVN
jgi:hypothetical protein